ncbi:hypothetical protein BHE74_00008674 [Ensete ventricosum]|nr:hypothetical protein BHE74_00008674 [Ensete ventricosum]
MLQLLKDTEPKTAPPEQKMSRKLSLEQEHKNALERAMTLDVAHAVVAATGDHSEVTGAAPSQGQESTTSSNGSKSSERTKWDELVSKLFTRDESGDLVLKKDMNTVDG